MLRLAQDMLRLILCVVLLCVVVAEDGKCALQEEDHGEEVEDYDLDDYADYEDEEDLNDEEEDYEYEDGHFVRGEL